MFEAVYETHPIGPFIHFCIIFVAIYWLYHFVKSWMPVRAGPVNQDMNDPASSSFASDARLKKAGLLSGKGILIGYTMSGCAVRYNGDAMIITIAPVGTGKTTTQVIPNCLDLDDRSLVIFCAKGETPAVVGHHRKSLGPFHLLNGYEILQESFRGLGQSSINPMDILSDPDEPPLNFNSNAGVLAEGISWRDNSGEDGSFFSSASRQLIHGVIMAVGRHSPPEERNLLRVAEIICTDEIYEFSDRVLKICEDDGIRQKLGKFAGGRKDDRALQAIVETARVNVSFLSEPAVSNTLKTSQFRFGDLRERVCTVAVTVPVDKMAISDRFFRLILSCVLGQLFQPGVSKTKVVIMLDEFYQYGSLPAVENAFGIARGYGIQIWPYIQDLSQLQGRYRSWETFLSNAAVRCYFTPQDEKTAIYVSHQCGYKNVVTNQPNISEVNGQIKVGWGKAIKREELMLPHQVRALPDGPEGMMICFIRGVGPVILRKIPYYKRPEYQGKYRSNPYHRGGL